LRFWVGSYIEQNGTRFPYGTLVIKHTGSFLIGLVFCHIDSKNLLEPELADT